MTGVELAIETATALGRGIHGVLRVGFTAAWSGTLILRATDRFRDLHPECTVELREVTYRAFRESLLAGEIDLTLAETGLVEADPEFVIGPTVFSRPQVLAVPAGLPLAGQDSVSLEDLAAVPLIVPEGVPDTVLDAHFPRRTPSGRMIPRGPIAAGWQEMLSLIGSGKGVTPTCDWAADYYARPDVAFIPFSDVAPVDQALIRSAARDSVAIRIFTHIVTEQAEADSPQK